MANEQLPPASNGTSNLVDVLEKVLDKGVVIAGDIRVGIGDVELLSIKIRLIVASVDKAKEIGLDWWETDPYLTSRATEFAQKRETENQELQQRIEQLENQLNANHETTVGDQLIEDQPKAEAQPQTTEPQEKAQPKAKAEPKAEKQSQEEGQSSEKQSDGEDKDE